MSISKDKNERHLGLKDTPLTPFCTPIETYNAKTWVDWCEKDSLKNGINKGKNRLVETSMKRSNSNPHDEAFGRIIESKTL